MAGLVDVSVSGSVNFGFLASLDPLLALDGAAAEKQLYGDPDASMVMARRFSETLAKILIRLTGTRVSAGSQKERIERLVEAGVLVPTIGEAFDQVRRTGNRAAHSRFGDARAALESVRICFELGVLFHKAITGDRTVRPFVPPADPQLDDELLADEDITLLGALHNDLDRHRRRLAEVLAIQPSAAGEDDAVPDHGTAAALAELERDQMRRIAVHLGNRLADVERTFSVEGLAPVGVAHLESASIAARWLVEAACDAAVRALDQRMRLDVGLWVRQDGERLTVSYSGSGGFRFTGAITPEFYVHDRSWTDEQTLMWVLADLERAGYVPADDPGTRVIRARLRVPGAMEFRSATEVVAPPSCPSWCIADHDGYADWMHECLGPGFELRGVDGDLVCTEPVQLTDACTGEVQAAMVRVGDILLDPMAARRYAAGILAAAAVADPSEHEPSNAEPGRVNSLSRHPMIFDVKRQLVDLLESQARRCLRYTLCRS